MLVSRSKNSPWARLVSARCDARSLSAPDQPVTGWEGDAPRHRPTLIRFLNRAGEATVAAYVASHRRHQAAVLTALNGEDGDGSQPSVAEVAQLATRAQELSRRLWGASGGSMVVNAPRSEHDFPWGSARAVEFRRPGDAAAATFVKRRP